MSTQGKETASFEETLDRNGYLAYTNVGVSMMPLLRQGKDVMEIRKKGPERCKKYDAVLYKVNDRYILHRIIKVREKDYVIVGDNCFRKEYGIADDQILGVLTGIVRDGKHISVTDKKYLCYVHIWCGFYPIRAGILYGRAQLGRVKSKLVRMIRHRRSEPRGRG